MMLMIQFGGECNCIRLIFRTCSALCPTSLLVLLIKVQPAQWGKGHYGLCKDRVCWKVSIPNLQVKNCDPLPVLYDACMSKRSWQHVLGIYSSQVQGDVTTTDKNWFKVGRKFWDASDCGFSKAEEKIQ